MDTKFDYSFFNVDPFKNHLEMEAEKDEMARLVCSLYYLSHDPESYSSCDFDQLFYPLTELFFHLDQYVDHKNDSGLETDDGEDYPLDYKRRSRAPAPNTTWHGRLGEQ